MDDGGLVAGRGKDGGGSNQVSVCMTAGGGCMDGDGLVAVGVWMEAGPVPGARGGGTSCRYHTYT